MKGDTYLAHEVNVVSNLCFGCYPFSWLLRSISIDDHVQLPLFAQSGPSAQLARPLSANSGTH